MYTSQLPLTHQPDNQLTRPGEYLDPLSGDKYHPASASKPDGGKDANVRVIPNLPVY